MAAPLPNTNGNMRTRGSLMYYQYDALGNVTDMTDHLGENIAKYRFDAFGGMFAGPLAPYSFQGITGKEYDPKSGLMFYNSRWYDPKVGRFTQADTFKGVQSQPGTQHPYAYVGNNPINNLDPTGHTSGDSWGTDVDGNDVGSDHYGDQSGSWNNYGEFEPDGGSSGDGSSGGGGGSSGGGGSHTPTPEERKGQYNQSSQSVPTMTKGLYSTLTQKVNKNKSMQAAPGVWNYKGIPGRIGRVTSKNDIGKIITDKLSNTIELAKEKANYVKDNYYVNINLYTGVVIGTTKGLYINKNGVTPYVGYGGGGGASLSMTFGKNKNLPSSGLSDLSLNVGLGFGVYTTDKEMGIGIGGKIGLSKVYVAPNPSMLPYKDTKPNRSTLSQQWLNANPAPKMAPHKDTKPKRGTLSQQWLNANPVK